MSLRRLVLSAAFGAALAGPTAAWADCVDCTCSINSSGLSFGSYNPRRPATNSVGVVAVNCTGAAGYLIKLSSGSSGTAAMRALTSGPSILNYNLFKDAPRSTIWGDGANGYTGVSGSGTGNYNVYGTIFGSQSPLVGTYIDMIIVSVEY